MKKLEEAASRRIMELEEAVRNDQVQLVSMEEKLAETEKAAQKRVEELEKTLKDQAAHLEQARQQIVELETATRGGSLPPIPGGLPTEVSNTEMDVDLGPVSSTYQSFRDIYCLKHVPRRYCRFPDE